MEEMKDKWIIEAEFNGEWIGYKKRKYTYDYKSKLFYYDNNEKYSFCGKVITLDKLKNKVEKSKTVQSCILYDECNNILYNYKR